MTELKFYRGEKSKYDKTLHGDGVYFSTDTHEIIHNGIPYKGIIDDDLLMNSSNPVKGSAVYKAIEDMVQRAIENTPIGSTIKLNSEGNARSISLIDSRTLEVLSTSDEWAVSSEDIDKSGLQLDFLTKELSVRKGDPAIVKFKHDVYNTQNMSTGEDASCQIEIFAQDGSSKDKFSFISKAGRLNEVDVTEYLEEGSYIFIKVSVTAITSDFGEQTKSGQIRAFLVNFKLTSKYDIATRTKRGNNITVPFDLVGMSNNQKKVVCYLDGKELTSGIFLSSGSFTIPTDTLQHGLHPIQLKAEVTIGDTKVSSNTLYLGAIIYEEGINNPIISIRIDYLDGRLVSGNPQIDIEQYDSYTLTYSVFDPSLVSAQAEFFSDGELVDSSLIESSTKEFKYRYTSSGIKKCSIRSKTTELIYYINVSQSSLLVEEVKPGLKLYLSAYGKSNSSTSRDKWTYQDINTSFENVLYGSDGWTGNSLRLMNGGKAIINYQPFSSNFPSGELTNEFSFNIRFKTSNIIDENEVLISCLDENGCGFSITAQEAKYTAEGGSTVSTKFAAGEIYDIGFVAFPKSEDENTLMLYLYVNGIICGMTQRGEQERIYQTTPNNIVISANNCILDIYSLRYYNTALDDNKIFSNYLVDLGDSDSFKSKYNSNNILDSNGNVSISSVCGKIPYFIVTGMQDNKVSTFHHAAVINNKKTKYKVDSILYVEGEDSPRNFIVVPNPETGAYPIIQLQGTSSLSYPRKNYKFIFKDKDASDKTIYPLMYLGCDPNGGGENKVLQSKPKFALTDTSIPVHTFCLKADFAESSSSHNTGTANLVHEILSNAKDLTPPQIYVDKQNFKDKTTGIPYDIRTTIEGYPCLIFYRATESDTPIFAGKYNFNNDKSTEDVFGFLDIPGYHLDSPYTETLKELAKDSVIFPEDFDPVEKEKVISVLEDNPTQCWEFLTNDNILGRFKEFDFEGKEKIKVEEEGKEVEVEVYKWLTMWESRFPDEDVLNAAFENGAKPKYLMRTAKWIYDTDTETATGDPLLNPIIYGNTTYSHDTAEYRAAKFKNEIKDYFNINILCDYYTITECIAAVDQRVKNMMWAFWFDPEYKKKYPDGPGDGVLCYPIFYDNDTILGVRNDGKLKFNWDINENTLDPDDPTQHAFMGHDSVLWKNLREQLSGELKASYKRLREGNMTNDKLFKYYDEEQSNKYCERLYNKDALYKYVIPKTVGVELNENGNIIYKTYNYEASAQGDRKSHRHWFITNRMDFFDAKHALTSGSSQMSLKAMNTVVDPETDSQVLKLTSIRDYYVSVQIEASGTPQPYEVKKNEEWIYRYEKSQNIGTVIFFSGLKWVKKLDMSNWKGISEMNIPNLPVIEEVILGNRSVDNTTLEVLPVSSNNISAVKRVTINNFKHEKITEFSFSSCIYLEYLDMRGCDSLTGGTFAENGDISEVYLPKNFKRLFLVSLPKLTIDNIHFENPLSVTQLKVENCDKINGIEYLEKLLVQGNQLSEVRITGLNLSGDGSDLIRYKEKVTKCELVGSYQLTTLLEKSLFEELKNYFTELDLRQPRYTTYIFDCSVTTPERITNTDNHSGWGYSKEYEASGHVKNILDKRKSYLVKEIKESSPYYSSGTFAACKLSDANSYLYNNETQADLKGSQGDYCMYEPHYWYKGVNDHRERKIYAFYSSEVDIPTVPKGKKITQLDLSVKKNSAVRATSGYNTIEDAITSDPEFNVYTYVLPEEHDYKRIRVTSVANGVYGAVVCDSNGTILKRYKVDSTEGMFTGSYIWFDLPINSSQVVFTVSSNANYQTTSYLAYITPSLDIEDLEPDWVEHKESFIGRTPNTPYNNATLSAYNINEKTKVSAFSSWGINLSRIELGKTISNRGEEYYKSFGYEDYREIFLLGYLKYGTTRLQNKVGIGKTSTGETIGYGKAGVYFPGYDHASAGLQDTKAMEINDYPYVSYYITDKGDSFPLISTLMGYHRLIGNAGTASPDDMVNRLEKTLKTRERNKIKLFSVGNDSIYRYNNYIQGGRYLDILGIGDNDNFINHTNGFSISECMDLGNTTQGYLICGYQAKLGKTQAAACFRISNGLDLKLDINEFKNGTEDTEKLDRILRVVIIPRKIVFFNDPTDYKSNI